MRIKATKNGLFKITDLTPDDLVVFRNFIAFCSTAKSTMYHENEVIRKFNIEFYRIQKEYAC